MRGVCVGRTFGFTKRCQVYEPLKNSLGCNALKSGHYSLKQLFNYPSIIPQQQPVATVIGCLGAPMGICPARVKKLMISTNICGKKLSASGYKFHYSFEEAIADWYKDNDNLYLK